MMGSGVRIPLAAPALSLNLQPDIISGRKSPRSRYAIFPAIYVNCARRAAAIARPLRVVHDPAQVICFPVRRSPATRAAFVAVQHRAGPILPLRTNQSRPRHRHLRWETTVIHRAARQIRAVFHMVGIGRPQCVSNMQQAKIFAICRIDRHSSVPWVVTITVAAQCGSG